MSEPPSIPDAAPPPQTLAALLAVAALRGLLGASALGLLVPGVGVAGTGLDLDAAWRIATIGAPAGFLLFAPTAAVEAFAVRRGLRWLSAALLTHTVGAVSLLLALAQGVYVLRLHGGRGVGAALTGPLELLDALSKEPLAAAILLACAPLPFTLSTLSRLELLTLRLNLPIGAVLLLGLGLSIWGLLYSGSVLLVTPVAVLLAAPLAVILVVMDAAADRLQRALLPEQRAWPAGHGLPESPPESTLTFGEWLALGGPTFNVGLVLHLSIGLAAFGWYGPWALAIQVPLFISHLLLRLLLPQIQIVRGRPERALAMCRAMSVDPIHELLDPDTARPIALVEARALAQLGRVAEVRAALETIGCPPYERGHERVQALHICQGLLNAGAPEDAEFVLGTEPFPGNLEGSRRINLSVALCHQERYAEALELIEELTFPRWNQRLLRALSANNKAVYALHLGRDPAQALAWAREACEAHPRQPLLRGTLGAALLTAGEPAARALEHMEAAWASDLPSERGRSWLRLYMAKAYAALDRDADAKAAFEETLTLDPSSFERQHAEAGLAALAERMGDQDRS